MVHESDVATAIRIRDRVDREYICTGMRMPRAAAVHMRHWHARAHVAMAIAKK